MKEKESILNNLEESFFGEDDIFNEKIFKKSDFVQDITLEDLGESE